MCSSSELTSGVCRRSISASRFSEVNVEAAAATAPPTPLPMTSSRMLAALVFTGCLGRRLGWMARAALRLPALLSLWLLQSLQSVAYSDEAGPVTRSTPCKTLACCGQQISVGRTCRRCTCGRQTADLLCMADCISQTLEIAALGSRYLLCRLGSRSWSKKFSFASLSPESAQRLCLTLQWVSCHLADALHASTTAEHIADPHWLGKVQSLTAIVRSTGHQVSASLTICKQ